ncbi:MAG: LysR substrate-binding domain-containing protein [Roseovarius sp.]|uniref:LysR substrate-binding domain-containing protein n=1 Tax=Roseovarius sp. TaxID=1486281 RepID=UPI0032EC734C
MRYAQIKAFHHVALLGGFSRAAEALSLTQPAISEQVRKLEQSHDTLLFHRDRRQVRLTEAGEALLRLTRPYFEAEAQINEHLSQSGAAVAGELRVIADAAHHVTGLLRELRTKHPQIMVSLRGGNTGEILDELRAYRAEIGVVGDIAPGPEFDTVPLGGAEIIAFAPPDLLPPGASALPLSYLMQRPLVLRETGSKTRQKVEEEAARQGLRMTPGIVAEGREAVRELVASGAGVGFVSRAELGADDRVRAVSIEGAKLRMDETLVCLSQRRDLRLIRTVMDLARRG